MNKNNLGFVLLPGGGMSSWVWRDLIPNLKKPSVAVDYRLPANTQEARQSATIRDCTDHIINQIERNKLERVILVGHSGAGVLAQDLLSEPLCAAFEKINWDNFPDIKQTYVILLKDTSMSVAKQKQMMSHLTVTNSVEIDSDHMVMLSHPRELAEVLNGVI